MDICNYQAKESRMEVYFDTEHDEGQQHWFSLHKFEQWLKTHGLLVLAKVEPESENDYGRFCQEPHEATNLDEFWGDIDLIKNGDENMKSCLNIYMQKITGMGDPEKIREFINRNKHWAFKEV